MENWNEGGGKKMMGGAFARIPCQEGDKLYEQT